MSLKQTWPISWVRLQLRLIKRRGGLRNHIKLQRRFQEIAQDPYVKAARSKNAR